jgi:hypothetical protein
MKPYADTNLLTQLYLNVADASRADVLIEKARNAKALPLPATWLLQVELTNAIEFFVFLSQRGTSHRIGRELALSTQATVMDDLRDGILIKTTELPLKDLVEIFRQVSLRHTAKHGFRTYDILHVSSALLLACDTFWSFDDRARHLAKLEGLTVN